MSISLRTIVALVAAFLSFASAISLYFSFQQEYTLPLLIVAGTNLGTVLILMFLITRGVVNPLTKIRALMKKVGEGNFNVRVEPLPTKEMRELGLSLNDMIGRLYAARERERQIDQLKTEFLSLAAHQLRNPLAEIKWALKAIIEDGPLTQEQKTLLEKTYNSNEHMISLINDLLDLAKIEEGKYLFQPQPVSIAELGESVIQSYKDEAKRRGIELVAEASEGDMLQVLLDREKMALAIQNLVENALQYTPRGGKVTVSFFRDTKGVGMSVADNGIGIPKAEQHRLFERFFRGSNARRLSEKGTGLGLYLTRNIVKAHGGAISFVSEENKGTTFNITLPYAKNFNR